MSISVISACKNRVDALSISVSSWILFDEIDEIIIVDWNSDDNVKKYLKKNNILSDKIKIIEVVNSIPWILSWAYNIGFFHAKNKTSLYFFGLCFLGDSYCIVFPILAFKSGYIRGLL